VGEARARLCVEHLREMIGAVVRPRSLAGRRLTAAADHIEQLAAEVERLEQVKHALETVRVNIGYEIEYSSPQNANQPERHRALKWALEGVAGALRQGWEGSES
jgi:hypothetical protein